MKRYYKIMSVITILALLCGTLMIFSGCQEEEETPWWKDYDNVEFILEDESSEEKSFTYKNILTERIEFNYKEDPNRKEEYIPKVRILHKGIEQKFYTKIMKREWFYKTVNGYDYDDPQLAVIVNEYGAYRVAIKYYLNPNDPDDHNGYVGEDHIYIIIHKGER